MKVGVFCVFYIIRYTNAISLITSIIDMCGPEREVPLQAHGEFASVTVNLNSVEKSQVCKLWVTAPSTHVVNFQLTRSDPVTIRTENKTEEQDSSPICAMSIFLPDSPSTPFWKGDPCTERELPEIDLLTNDFKILWTPPADPSKSKGRQLILTAVGSGAVCKGHFQHTCMRIGRVPMLCVSDHLLCDGHENCPKSSSSSDEEEKLCKNFNADAQNAWEKLAVQIIKQFKPPPATAQDAKWSMKTNASTSPKKWHEWQLMKKNATTINTVVLEENHTTKETISSMLNKYGPWGYLMLGLLICGTVLFFCGLWECCCRKPKPEIDPPPPTQQPTTVLIMNCGQGEGVPQPPNYDELDQPPSYTTLFPNKIVTLRSTTNDNTASTSENNEQSTDESVT